MEDEKKKWSASTILGVVGFFVVMAAVLYACFAYYYMRTIFPGTTINGIDAGEMSVEHVEALLEEKVEDYQLELTFRDGSSNIIDGMQIGYEYISTGEIQKILDNQDVWKWILHVFADEKYEVAETIQFDEEKLTETFYELENISAETQIKPIDAYVTYEAGEFCIIPEEEGNLIKKNELYNEIKQAITTSQTELDVSKLPVYVEPAVRKDSPKLAKEMKQLNELAAVSVTHVLPNGQKTLDGNEVRTWLHVDEDGNYSITEAELKEKAAEYIAELAKEVNTVGTARKFKSTKRGVIDVSGGSYGYKINQKAEIKQLMEEITSHTVINRNPIYSSEEVTDKNNGLGDTYIEIDLSNQRLWYYIDGELYVESPLVSGTYYASDRRTPPGIFLLSYKTRNAVLRGELKEDGTYTYESPVSYWMPFNRGIGLHDASWRGAFGGNIYLYSGSHGCINLPYNNAKAIYGKIDHETPIILYY